MGFNLKDFLEGTLNGARQTMERGIIAAPKGVIAPIYRGVRGAAEAINPNDDESKGNQAIDSANQRYKFTDEFKKTLDSTNPYVADGQWAGGGANEGIYYPRQRNSMMNSRMRINPQSRNSRDTVLHEGLHAAWDYHPDRQQEFVRAYNEGATPELRQWLVGRVKDYPEAAQQASDAYMDVGKMTPGLRDEVHSFIPEYRQSTNNSLGSLDSYYSKYYYDPQQARLRQLLGITGGINGL